MVKAELKVNFEDWFMGVVTIFTLGAMYTNKFENAGCGMWNWTMGKRKIFGAEFDCLLQCYCDPLKEYYGRIYLTLYRDGWEYEVFEWKDMSKAMQEGLYKELLDYFNED